MTSAPEGFEEPLRGPGGWREQLRRSVVARMPEDSRRRCGRGGGRDTLWTCARRRDQSAGTGPPWVVECPAPPYPVWRLSHGPSSADLAAQRARATRELTGLDVRVW